MAEESRFLREAENDRLRLASADAQANKGVWMRAFGAWGQMTGNGTAKLNDSIDGAFVGVDSSMFDDVRVGGVFGFSHSTFSASARNTTGSSDDYWFGVYGGKPWGNLALRTGAGYTYHDATTSHAVNSTASAITTRTTTAQVFGPLPTAAVHRYSASRLRTQQQEPDRQTDRLERAVLHGWGVHQFSATSWTTMCAERRKPM